MGNSKIEWTDKTWNPIRGCSVVSEGCRNCYAMNFAARFAKPGEPFSGLAYRSTSGAHWTGEVRLIDEHIDDPLRWRKPAMVFVNSMSDLFHESIETDWITRIFNVMLDARRHTFQVLTKRPDRTLDYCTRRARNMPIAPNVWLGVSVEDQKTADERIPLLLQTPAAVRWISAEPLLGPIDLRNLRGGTFNALDGIDYENIGDIRDAGVLGKSDIAGLDWVVVGGESGQQARPMHPDWARSLRDQCVAADVPFFFKQWGEWAPTAMVGFGDSPRAETMTFRTGQMVETYGGPVPFAIEMRRIGKKAAGRLLDGVEWNQYPQVQAKVVTA